MSVIRTGQPVPLYADGRQAFSNANSARDVNPALRLSYSNMVHVNKKVFMRVSFYILIPNFGDFFDSRNSTGRA